MSYWVSGALGTFYIFPDVNPSSSGLITPVGPFKASKQTDGSWIFTSNNQYFNGAFLTDAKTSLTVTCSYSLSSSQLYAGVLYSISGSSGSSKYYLVPLEYYQLGSCTKKSDGPAQEISWRSGQTVAPSTTTLDWCKEGIKPTYCPILTNTSGINEELLCGPSCYGLCKSGECKYNGDRFSCNEANRKLTDDLGTGIIFIIGLAFLFALIFALVRRMGR